MAGKWIYIAVFSALTLLHSSDSSADFYKYVDKEGVVHITNVPTSAKYRWMMDEDKKSSYRPSLKGSGAGSVYSRKKFEELIHSTAVRYGVDPTLVKAIVKAESDFDAGAISVDGARGLMQLMPGTARVMGVRDVHDPEENVEGGIKYLSKLLRMFEWKVPLAVAAYNAGENAVLKYGSIPPYEETRTYVKRVMHYYKLYNGSGK